MLGQPKTPAGAHVKAACQIDGSGALTMDTPGGIDAIDIDQSTSFSALPSSQQANGASSSTGSAPQSLTPSTGSDFKPHEVVGSVTNESSSVHDVVVEVYLSSSKNTLLGSYTKTGVASSGVFTFSIPFNPRSASTAYVEARYSDGSSDSITLSIDFVNYWNSKHEWNAKGIAFLERTDEFFAIQRGVPQVGKGVEIGGTLEDPIGKLRHDGSGGLEWVNYGDGSVTQVA